MNNRHLFAVLLAIFGCSSLFAGGAPKPKPKGAAREIFPYPYPFHPTSYADDLMDTDAFVLSRPMDNAHVHVDGETISQAWDNFQSALKGRVKPLDLALLEEKKDIAAQPDLNVFAIRDVYKAAGVQTGVMIRGISPDGIYNLSSRINYLGDRSAGKTSAIIMQCYVVLGLRHTSFDSSGATLELSIHVVPCGVTGLHPSRLRDSRELVRYIKDWLEGQPSGPIRKNPLVEAMKPIK